jgi:hypothetical protein
MVLDRAVFDGKKILFRHPSEEDQKKQVEQFRLYQRRLQPDDET